MSPRDSQTPPDDTLDPEAPPTEEELAAAEALRRAFDRGRAEPGNARADWDLVEAVRAAASPAAISRAKHRRIVDASLERKARGKVIGVAFGGVASLVAMAAALAIVMRSPSPKSAMEVAAAPPKMALSRSTAGLFPDGIPPAGGTSDRVDRIAYARARDLRENRFARWGVR